MGSTTRSQKKKPWLLRETPLKHYGWIAFVVLTINGLIDMAGRFLG